MGRHEIRLQRKKMTSRRIQSHKNYYEVLKRHERSGFGKKMLKLVIYLIVVLGIILLAYFGLQQLEAVKKSRNPMASEDETIVGLLMDRN